MTWYAEVKREKDNSKLLATLAEELENLSFRISSVQTQILKVQKIIALANALASGELDGMTELEKRCWSVYEKGPPQRFYLTLPVAPPRLEIHWQRWPQVDNRKEVREAWYNLVNVAWDKAARGMRANLPPRPLETFIAAFRFNYGNKIKKDVDNYAIKFIIDALTKCNIIIGDDSERMSIFVTARYGNEWKTEVLIYETQEITCLPPDLIVEMNKMEKIAETRCEDVQVIQPEKSINGNLDDWI
ncbi:hypothetical protein SDD30_16225 [Moorella naiadis]|uniref:hypothetical protein n=1 Tax=Moorella naiadis (nom. illeg.) TaxID=3093670 RepID=UPI003D9C956B